MKHFFSNVLLAIFWLGKWRIIIIALLLLPVLSGLHAQTFECLGNDEQNPLVFSVDTLCELTISKELLLADSNAFEGSKTLVIRDAMSNEVAQGSDTVTFNASIFIDEVLSVTVEDDSTGFFCVSFIEIVDTIAPVFECETLMINCIADTSVAVIGSPIINSNCDTNFVLTYEDQVFDEVCGDSIAAVINRNWTATDTYGNVSNCVQPILLIRPDLNDITFPANVTLDCTNPDASISNTGQPTLNGEIISGNSFCDLAVGFTDDTIALDICGAIEYSIDREWHVIDLCADNFTVIHNQSIVVTDTIPPVISCSAEMFFTTDPGQCSATINLPEPSFSDNCDAAPIFNVATSYGAVGLGPHTFVPVGTHTVMYTATDLCGNTSEPCILQITITDEEEPSAVCEETTIVSIPSSGVAVVMAETFDDGSSDNCAEELFFKVKRMDEGSCDGINGDDSEEEDGAQEWFDDMVLFCCEEAELDNIMLQFRVYEINPGDGPVDPAREAVGGDLFGKFTTCMVEVDVQDKISPILIGPEDDTIACGTDLEDLSIFGTAIASDNCGFVLDSTEVVEINECGTGSITRTFTATDPSGNATTVVQTITIENQTPFDESQIVWPEDFTSYECGVAVEPEDLPEGFNQPVILDESCAIIGINREDLFFSLGADACYKILRTWDVLDWCTYDSENPDAGGRFTHVQIIKILDTIAPVIICPDEITVGIGPDCQTGSVSLPLVTAEDCSDNITITNDSPFASENGADASGDYPMGITNVTFTASDGCGNTSTCLVPVRVVDNTPPSPLCIVGLSANLAVEDEELASATVEATAFDGGSVDNCSIDQDLTFTVRRAIDNPETPPTATSLTFTCEDLGSQVVEFWVTDEFNNSNFCLTFITVQDNNNLCGELSETGMIAGHIATEQGMMVENVTVDVTSANTFQTVTGADGAFEFVTIPIGGDYNIIPHRDEEPMNGISTLDMVLVSKHILGVADLGSPYKIIAADIDNSGSVSTLDLIKMRKLILNIDSSMPENNSSWRFIDANFIFPNPANPFETEFPELLNLADFNEDEMEADFIAIKVGDVNGSATPSTLSSTEPRSAHEDWGLYMPNIQLEKGATQTITLMAQNLKEIAGYQFTLGFDPEKVKINTWTPGQLEGLDANNFGDHAIEEGWLTTSWNAAANQSEGALINLTVTALETVKIEEVFVISSKLTKAEAYNDLGEIMNIQLHFENEDGSIQTADQLHLYQNRPNPFDESTVIAFELPAREKVSFQVLDVAGKILYQKEDWYNEGYHEILLKQSDLAKGGVLYYKLDTPSASATKKMILMK